MAGVPPRAGRPRRARREAGDQRCPPGLKQAIAEVFVGAAWQRCRVHFMRNVLARVPKSAQAMVAATVRTIFEQPDRAQRAAQLRQVCDVLAARFPSGRAAARGSRRARCSRSTTSRWSIGGRSTQTNPLERLNKELKRRSAVVGIFPNRAAVLRLFCALLAEQNDEWLVGQHRYFSETSMAKILNSKQDDMAPPLPPQAAAA